MRIKSHKIITDPIDRDFLKICIFAYLDKIYLHDDQINYKNCTHTHTHTKRRIRLTFSGISRKEETLCKLKNAQHSKIGCPWDDFVLHPTPSFVQ